MILLDGLDEVADKAQRLAVIRGINRAREQCVYKLFIVTSRFAGYFGEYQLSGNILSLSIQAFTEEEIAEFLGNWFMALAGSQGMEKAVALAEIIRGDGGFGRATARFYPDPRKSQKNCFAVFRLLATPFSWGQRPQTPCFVNLCIHLTN